MNKVATTGSALTSNQKTLVDQALSSSYGIQKINEAYLTELDTAIIKIDGVISKVTDATNKAFLQTDFGRLFLIDYNNQFYIAPGGEMEQFLQGGLVTLGYGKTVSVNGNLGIEDLLNFYLRTKYGQDKPGDLIRRFSNVLEEVGISNILLTAEDAKFLAEDLRELLGKSYSRIIFRNDDNWGIRNLIFDALALYYGGDLTWRTWDYYNSQFMIDHSRQSFTTAKAAPTPLILDLDGDGVETTSLNDGSYFDHDANGFAEQTGWAGADDGLLVWDRNGDGRINDGKELFGDQTLLKNGTSASNGFQALAEWDDNLDGKIDANDSIWSNLKVWQEYGGDGYSSPDELRTPSDLGIACLSTGR